MSARGRNNTSLAASRTDRNHRFRFASRSNVYGDQAVHAGGGRRSEHCSVQPARRGAAEAFAVSAASVGLLMTAWLASYIPSRRAAAWIPWRPCVQSRVPQASVPDLRDTNIACHGCAR
jgi:hypothetical protein